MAIGLNLVKKSIDPLIETVIGVHEQTLSHHPSPSGAVLSRGGCKQTCPVVDVVQPFLAFVVFTLLLLCIATTPGADVLSEDMSIYTFFFVKPIIKINYCSLPFCKICCRIMTNRVILTTTGLVSGRRRQ